MPVLFREPSINLGVGDARGQVPHVTGRDFLDLYKIPAGSAPAYALTSEDFAALAKSYGRLGGLDRIATVLKAIRAERGDRTVFLDGGDTWQNSYTSMRSQGPGHGRLHGAAEARRHGRPLGVHARRRARQGDHREARLPVPRAEHPRHRMERSRRSSR